MKAEEQIEEGADLLAELDREAAEAEEKAQKARAKQETITARLWERRAQREKKWDASFLDAYNDRALERDAQRASDEARLTFLASPIGESLVAEQVAALWRRELWMMANSVSLETGGRPLQEAPVPVTEAPGQFGRWVEAEARRIVGERLDALQDDRERFIAGEKVPAPLSG